MPGRTVSSWLLFSLLRKRRFQPDWQPVKQVLLDTHTRNTFKPTQPDSTDQPILSSAAQRPESQRIPGLKGPRAPAGPTFLGKSTD